MIDDPIGRVSEDVKILKVIAVITIFLLLLATQSQGWF